MRDLILMPWKITVRNWLVYKQDLVANTSPTIADPALIMVSLGLGLGSFLADVEGMTYMQFLAPGLTIATALFTSFFESSYGFYVRMTFENIFKAMLTTPMSVRDIVLGELVWVGLKGFIMALGVGVALALFGFMKNPWLLPFVGVIGFAVAVPCGAIGLIASATVSNINQFQTVYSFIIAPLFYLSGIFFPITNMASALRIFADIFPVSHGVLLAQAVFWEKGILDAVAYSAPLLVLQAIVLSVGAYKLVHRKLIG
jgi:lipooligosaccharide transport system permease protein